MRDGAPGIWLARVPNSNEARRERAPECNTGDPGQDLCTGKQRKLVATYLAATTCGDGVRGHKLVGQCWTAQYAGRCEAPCPIEQRIEVNRL